MSAHIYLAQGKKFSRLGNLAPAIVNPWTQ